MSVRSMIPDPGTASESSSSLRVMDRLEMCGKLLEMFGKLLEMFGKLLEIFGKLHDR